jgi:hypothetical protein
MNAAARLICRPIPFTTRRPLANAAEGLVRVDVVEKVPKCLLAIFSKETKLNYARRLIWHPGIVEAACECFH